MARIEYGKTFTTRRGIRGRYKYVNGRRVSFVTKQNRKFESRTKKRFWKRKFRSKYKR